MWFMESLLKYKIWWVDLLQLSFLLEFNLCIEQYELILENVSGGATKRKCVKVTQGFVKKQKFQSLILFYVCGYKIRELLWPDLLK